MTFTTLDKKEHFEWNIDSFSEEQVFEKADYGVKLVIPPYSVQDNQTIDTTVQIVDSNTSDIELPEGVQLVSCLYEVQSSGIFNKPIELHLQHNVDVMSQDDIKRLVFITSDGSAPYCFKISDDEQHFGINDNSGLIKVSHFSKFGIAWLLRTVSDFLEPICSYTMILCYKSVMKSCWQIKVVITQNLGPFQVVRLLAYYHTNLY